MVVQFLNLHITGSFTHHTPQHAAQPPYLRSGLQGTRHTIDTGSSADTTQPGNSRHTHGVQNYCTWVSVHVFVLDDRTQDNSTVPLRSRGAAITGFCLIKHHDAYFLRGLRADTGSWFITISHVSCVNLDPTVCVNHSQRVTRDTVSSVLSSQ